MDQVIDLDEYRRLKGLDLDRDHQLATTFLHQGFPYRALEFAPQSSIELRAKAYIQLGQYLQAIETLQRKRDEYGELYEEAVRKKEQAATGREIDLLAMLQANLEDPRTEFSHLCTDYMHGSVRVDEDVGGDGSRGRGLVAGADIDPGRIIILSKAFAILKTKESELAGDRRGVSGTISPLHGQSFKLLVNKIHDMLTLEPEKINEFNTLYAGIGGDSVDLRTRIEFACNLNAFVTRSGLPSSTTSPSSIPNGPGEAVVVDKLVKMGLWIRPALLNHDCLDFNCDWAIYGENLVVRSVKPIYRGQELLLPYNKACHSSPTRRREYFDREFGFACTCRWCYAEKKLSRDHPHLLTRLDTLLTRWEAEPLQVCGVEERAETLAEVLSLVQSIPSEVSPCLCPLLRSLGKGSFGVNDWGSACSINKLALHLLDLNDFPTPLTVHLRLSQVVCLVRLCRTEEAGAELRSLRRALRLSYGGVGALELVSLLSLEEVEGFVKDAIFRQHLLAPLPSTTI